MIEPAGNCAVICYNNVYTPTTLPIYFKVYIYDNFKISTNIYYILRITVVVRGSITALALNYDNC